VQVKKDVPVEIPALMSLYLDGGIYLWTKGWLADGRALTGHAKALSEAALIDGPMTAQIYSFHASILSDSGDMDEGLFYFERSLEILKNHLGSGQDSGTSTDQTLLANAWNNLAGIHCAMGNYLQAEMYNELSLQLKQKLQERGCPMSHLLCLSYENMASTCAGQGRYDDAAQFFEKALRAATLEESASRRALTSHNFGIMRFMQGETKEAIRLLEIAYELRVAKLGDHADTAASSHMLACCYHEIADEYSLQIARYVISL
jgi:tetratricopeptide (TPR) repeat protein